ncbi:hypothetical protein BT69DRAFT_365629 [Atractiella rhizophila]|nr:hypothetical protein BT69DRAFT_365629 [Atractiella rhizophila]
MLSHHIHGTGIKGLRKGLHQSLPNIDRNGSVTLNFHNSNVNVQFPMYLRGHGQDVEACMDCGYLDCVCGFHEWEHGVGHHPSRLQPGTRSFCVDEQHRHSHAHPRPSVLRRSRHFPLQNLKGHQTAPGYDQQVHDEVCNPPTRSRLRRRHRPAHPSRGLHVHFPPSHELPHRYSQPPPVSKTHHERNHHQLLSSPDASSPQDLHSVPLHKWKEPGNGGLLSTRRPEIRVTDSHGKKFYYKY